MQERREWLRFSAVGVAALLGIPGDLVSLGLDRLFSHLDASTGARARVLSAHIADALAGLARHHDSGAVESARLASKGLLARFGVSDRAFVALDLNSDRAADAVLGNAHFSSDERIEIEPLCRQLLVRFYQSVVGSPNLFADLLPNIHQEHLRRLGHIESKQDRAQETLDDISAKVAELGSAVAGGDRQVVQELIDSQVDIARRLIEAHRPHAAIELLQGILEVATDRLDARLHFRALSNLGKARLLLLDERKAGLLFLEAAKHAPDDDDQTVAQHAHGHLLLGELDAAERVACAGAERFPDSGRLQAMRLAITNHRGQLGDPEGAIPDGFRSDFHVAYTIAYLYALRDDLDRAVKWIKSSYEADPKSWQGRKVFTEILLRVAVESNLQLLGGTNELKSDFHTAMAELEEIWEVIRTGEPIEASAVIAAQLAMARGLAGDRDGARRVCDAGLAMGPPPPPLVQVAAKLAEEDRRFGDVVNLLTQAGMRRMPELDILLATAQVELGRDDDALRTLIELAEDNDADPSLRTGAWARSIELRARRGITSELLDELAGLVKTEPDVVAYRVVAGSIYEEIGEHDDALVQANAARELLDQHPTLDNQVSVANLLLDLDEPSDAAEIYAHLAPHSVDSKLGRRLLRALLAADRRAALRARLDAMPASEKTDQFYLWIEAALLERIGELAEALDLLTAYLRNRPQAAGLRLSWIGLLERLDRASELRDFLAQNADLPTATPIQQLQYAHVLRRHGFTSEALQLGYDAVRRAKRDPDAHVAYISLVLFTPAFEPFDRDTVEPDQGFIFASDGGVHRTFVVEAEDPLDLRDSVPPNHPIARAAIGKRVGDRLEVEEGPYSRVMGTIVTVRHKYLVLADDLMENFSHRFPGHTGLFKVAIRELEGAKPDFSALMRAVEDRAGRERSISNQYMEDRLPLPVIAKMLGEHTVRAWGKLSGRRGGIIVCDGNSEEIEAAGQLLRAADGLMMDPITLSLIHELGVGDALVAIGVPLGIIRSTTESLEGLIEELAIHHDGMKSLGVHEGQFVFMESAPEAMATYLQEFQGLVTWARRHCEEVPAIAESDLPDDARRLGTAIDRSFMDTIIAARARGWLLLSDDLHFRRIWKLLNVNGVWMQPVLQMALERKTLSDSSYHDAVIKLTLLNHNFTSIHGHTLLRAAERASWRLTSEVERLLQNLTGRNVEIRSAVSVLAQFLHGLLLSSAPRKRRARIFAVALEAFEKHHADIALEIHEVLGHVAERAFPLRNHWHSSRRGEWKEHIDGWRARLRRKNAGTQAKTRGMRKYQT